MKLTKLTKLFTDLSYEKIFGVTEYNDSLSSSLSNEARNVSYDDDSISDLENTINSLISIIEDASSEVEDIEDAADEWRSIALDMWENLPADTQEHYLMTHELSEKRKQLLRKNFDLEVLKDL